MDRAGQTGLQLAARGGKRSIVAYLLSKNARADRADSEGWTPLRAAAWGGHTEVFEMLLNVRTLRNPSSHHYRSIEF